ncbi:hypothetical protein CsSME_00008155 [Camellia sinensis var. sinensis]
MKEGLKPGSLHSATDYNYYYCLCVFVILTTTSCCAMALTSPSTMLFFHLTISLLSLMSQIQQPRCSWILRLRSMRRNCQ